MMKEPEAGVPAKHARLDGPNLGIPSPNPVAASSIITFSLPEATTVELAIYDVFGRRVAVLADGRLEAGQHSRAWDGRTDKGRRVSPGVYLVRMSTGEFSATRKAVVLK
jgi:flagellar hook assembly protein FlgD